VEAYIDESGAKGFLRNLGSTTDDDIALFAAIAVSGTRSDFRVACVDPFEKFKAARPAGAGQLHFTDAFAPGNEAWAAVAEGVRREVIALIGQHGVKVIYEARRLGVARGTFEREQELRRRAAAAAAGRESPIVVNERSSSERVEESCMGGLILKIECYCADHGFGMVTMIADQMDGRAEQSFNRKIAEARSVSGVDIPLSGWNRETGSRVERVLKLTARDALGRTLSELNATHLGKLRVLGKTDPLVFVADVVANSLHDHLLQLPPGAPLNAPSSVASWELGNQVYGNRDDAFEDVV